MKSVTTKAIAKVAAVATGLAMATSMLSLAPIAHAAALTPSQVQSILSLLTSFGADSGTIANVQASLTGGTPSTTTTTTTTTSSSSYTFTRDLTVGSTGADVQALQTALIADGYLNIATPTTYFGALTKAALAKWQAANNVAPAAGYFGPKTRAVFTTGGSTGTTTTTTGTGTTTTAVGSGLKVMLSPTSPNGTVLVQGQGIGDLGDFVFTNPSNAPINVTGLSFNRTGVSNDATLANVYLYNAGTRITDSAGVSASAFSFTNPTALFTVPANSSYTVSVRSDIAGSSSGQQLGVQLVSVNSNGTLDGSVSFPISSGYQTISNAILAGVSFQANVTPSNGTNISPQTGYPVWQDTVSVTNNPVKFSSLRLTNLGSIDTQYVQSLALYVDGTQVGSTIPSGASQSAITFDLSANPVLLSTSSHIIKVLANITGGASRTLSFSVQRSSDAMFIDSQLGQPVTPGSLGNVAWSGAVTAGPVTINSVSVGSGVSVSLDPSSPSQSVAYSASNVKWATFDFLASGENVKVSDLYVYATTTGAGGLANGKILVNGVQVGSTKSIGTYSSPTDFSLGSSLILPAGQTTLVSIYGDAKDTSNNNLPNGTSVTVTLNAGSSNGQGQSSLNATNVPGAPISSNGVVVSNSQLTATAYSGYGNQTVVPGSNNAKLGAFTLSTGSTEGVTVNTITLSLLAGAAAELTNLTLKDDATGNVLGTVQTTPSTSNSFSVNYDIPVSSTKVVDVYGNVLSNASVSPIQLTVTTATSGNGDVTGSPVSASQSTLQNITVGTGTLTVTRGAGDPTSNNVLAGASQVQVGEFNFASQNTSYTVQNLAILVPNGVASSVTNVTVSYKDVNGATQTATQALAINSANQFATATFTGLTDYVPANDSSNIDVYVGTPTVASGATSGAKINVSLDEGNTSTAVDNTFRAINSAGAAITTPTGGSGLTLASNGTFVVRKSIPTFANVATGNSVPSTGSPLYKFTISADPAGAIEWTHLRFNVSTTSTTVTNAYLTDDSSGASLLDTGTYASTTATTITVDLPTNNNTLAKYAQVAAGATKTYDLYGTVSGWPTGASLTISLAADTGTAQNNTATGTVAASPTVGFVWSDRSSTNPSHSISSSDWTNGYLLKNFTSNATTYSH
ncbi:MAG: peptidoglycan-binding domain-containing protein [Minisyncoccia bacterium]